MHPTFDVFCSSNYNLVISKLLAHIILISLFLLTNKLKDKRFTAKKKIFVLYRISNKNMDILISFFGQSYFYYE